MTSSTTSSLASRWTNAARSAPAPALAPALAPAPTPALALTPTLQAIWDDGLRIKREADAKVKAVHFDRGDRGWAMLEEGPNGTPRLPKVPPTCNPLYQPATLCSQPAIVWLPKVPLSDDWLVYKNYVDFQVSRKQEVGSRKQEAGIRKQEAGSRTRGKQKVVSSKQKVGSSK